MIKQKGFTLIELLIVIVILGILAGVVLAVINPAAQQTRANQSVLRASTEKICIAVQACAASTLDALNCDTAADAGYTAPAVPAGAVYAIANAPASAAGTITVTGTLAGCVFGCSATPSTGGFVNLAQTSAAGTCAF